LAYEKKLSKINGKEKKWKERSEKGKTKKSCILLFICRRYMLSLLPDLPACLPTYLVGSDSVSQCKAAACSAAACSAATHSAVYHRAAQRRAAQRHIAQCSIVQRRGVQSATDSAATRSTYFRLTIILLSFKIFVKK